MNLYTVFWWDKTFTSSDKYVTLSDIYFPTTDDLSKDKRKNNPIRFNKYVPTFHRNPTDKSWLVFPIHKCKVFFSESVCKIKQFSSVLPTLGLISEDQEGDSDSILDNNKEYCVVLNSKHLHILVAWWLQLTNDCLILITRNLEVQMCFVYCWSIKHWTTRTWPASASEYQSPLTASR